MVDNSVHDFLAQYLFHLEPDYNYAAAFSEQNLARGSTIQHTFHCNICITMIGVDIRGSRFKCLNCLTTDLCADCHTNWEKSNGEMDFCKGHIFYELPRSCWYQFEEGVVLEDGSTLPDMIGFLEEKFAALLESTRGE